MIYLRRNFKILLLLFTVFGIYYPAIFSGFNLVDDEEIFGRLEEAQHFDFIGLFRSADQGYYRPLTILTFYFDKAVWGLEPSFMHLENVILHALNTFLVFLIAEKAFLSLNARKYELPLLSALLFALHPVNTETVNWISGRYDLLAALFILVTTVFIQRGLEKRTFGYFALSSISLLVGCLAKESVWFFFPAAVFLVLYSTERLPEQTERETPSPIQKWKALIPLASGFLFYSLYRIVASRTGDNGVGKVIDRIVPEITYRALETAKIALKIFGFYIKKLFLPLPLNFAIDTINDAYLWVGLFFLIVVFFFLVRRTTVSDYFLVSLSMISPGLFVVFARTAWTPVAERYLYISSAFFVIAIVGLAFLIFKRYHRETWVAAGALPIILGAAIVTAQRTIEWQDNLSLYQDAVRKSPKFRKLNNELASALKDNGRIAEADALLSASQADNPDHVFLYINQADLLLKQGKTDAARGVLLKAFQNKKSAHPEVLKMLARIDEVRLFETAHRSKRAVIARELIDTYGFLYPKDPDPLCLYRSGQLLLLLGQQKRAGEFFQRAYEAAPDGMYYKDPAKKLAGTLKGNEK
jgi:protein O-mannosyl-transferase